MLKELFLLIKMFFKKVDCNKTELEVLVFKHFPFSGFSAFMWCGYLIDRDDNYGVTPRTKRHELIHYKQLCSLGGNFKYYICYLFEWMKQGMFGNAAYFTNLMEIEAYANDNKLNYTTYKGKYKKYKMKNARKEYKLHKYNWKEYVQEYFKDAQ